jgi:trimethylamine--corrinoid protein Co-methyltransferase
MGYWTPLTEADLDQIHEAACRILAELGMIIRHRRAVEVLVAAGARRIDATTVRIPQELVEQAIELAPATFSVYDRRGRELRIGGDSHHHLPGGTMTEILEYPGFSRRPATLRDVAQLTRISDALDEIHIAVPMVEGMDAPAGMGEILSCAEVLKNSTRFTLACPVEARAVRAFVAMAKALTGTDDLSSRPTIALLASIVPGYEMDEQAAETLLIAADEGLPVVLMGGGIQGAQAPPSMAGCLVMKVAEELAALCIAQLVRPGTPVLLGGGVVKLDMRTAELEEAGPEFSLGIGAGAQLARRYGIPSYACPSADSKVGDLQAGFEFGETFMAAMLAGANVTVNAGTAAKCSAASYELLVLHNEMLRNMRRVRQGMTISDATLAVEMQLQVGLRGDYLARPETLQAVRSGEEFLHKDLFDATGIRAAADDPMALAQRRWQELLRDHDPGVTAAEVDAIDSVLGSVGAA